MQVDCKTKTDNDQPLYSTDTNAKVLSTSKIYVFSKLNPNAASFIPRGDSSMGNVIKSKSINKSSDIRDSNIRRYPYPVFLNPGAVTFCPKVKRVEISIQGNPAKSENNDHDLRDTLHQLRLSNINKIIIGHLNINSLRNKFEMLTEIVKGAIDILIISETKLDESFPQPQFYIYGYSKPFRLGRTSMGRSYCVYS